MLLSISPVALATASADTDVNYMSLIVEALLERDFEAAKQYNELRNQKIILLELQDTYPVVIWDDAFCLTCTIYQEEGAGKGVSDNVLLAQGNCVLNRANSYPRFHYNTVRGILEAPGQYANFMKRGVYLLNRGDTAAELAAIERSWYIALRVLAGEKAINDQGIPCPDNMVWASRDRQGKVWWRSPTGTYFCT